MAGSVRQQLSVCGLAMILATAMIWWAYASFGDLKLSLALGGVAFACMMSLAAGISDPDAARRRQIR